MQESAKVETLRRAEAENGDLSTRSASAAKTIKGNEAQPLPPVGKRPFFFRVAMMTDTTELPDSIRRLMGIVFMLIAVLISFPEYSYTKKVLKIWDTNKVENIRPSLESTLCAIVLVMSSIIRNRTSISVYTSIIYILNILFCASFMSLFFSGEPWKIPIIPFIIDIKISSQHFLILAILASWLSMRTLSGFIWIALFFLSVTRLSEMQAAMGAFGVVYVLSAFLSIFCQTKDLMVDFIPSLKNDFLGYNLRRYKKR